MLHDQERIEQPRLRLARPLCWPAIAGVAAALVAGLGTSGCGEDDDNDGASGGTTAMAGSASAMAGTGGARAMGGMAGAAAGAGGAAPMQAVSRGDTPNGLALPDDLLDWRMVGVVQRPDDDSIRVVVGNDIAVDAARAGQTDPWPEGSMLAHYVWAAGNNPNNDNVNPDFLASKEFRAVTLMVKDSQEYADDGGWAYGIWRGPNLEPPTDPAFDRACVNCHVENVADNDYVFTIPGTLPALSAVQAAGDAPNGVSLPPGFLDWRVVGAISRPDSIRVIVGNDTAVDAARDGETNPWPEGSMLGHFVWAPGANAASTAALSEAPVAPGNFTALTLVVKDSTAYAADDGWAFGTWTTASLTAPTAIDFDRACVNCHAANVSENDFIFTVPGALP
jgi:hypothetical protein